MQGNRLAEELESLRKQISQLLALVIESPDQARPGTGVAEVSLSPTSQLTPDRLIQSNSNGIFAFDLEGVVRICNAGMERLFGIRQADCLGKYVSDAFPFLLPTAEGTYIQEALKGRSVVAQDRPHLLSESGEEIVIESHYGPVYDEGRIVGGFAMILDVTQRRSYGDDTYRELFENTNDIIYVHDLSGKLTSINRAVERVTGYAPMEVLGINLTRFVAPESLDAALRMIERQASGESPASYELDLITKAGQRVSLEFSARLIFREGKGVAVQGIARDITERQKAKLALQKENRQLKEWASTLEQRTREMALLSEMGDMLRACLTTEEAYGVTVRVAQQIFPVQTGALYVIASSRNSVEAVTTWGETALAERVFAPDDCWALRRGRVHWIDDTRAGLLCKHLPQPPPRGYLCVPMMAQGEALGVLHLTQPENEPLTEDKQRLAVAMAEHIAMALSNLKLHETLRTQSIRDPVTKLFNRSFMEESLELELRRATRKHDPVGIITIDIDHFKEFNEVYGREAGDTMIQEIGGLIRTNVRKEDIACRLGGQRFAILLPQGNIAIGQQRAEGLRQLIMNLEVRYRNRPLGPVTISLGVAGFPDHGRTGEALLRASDSALRRAKEEGGNRVVTAR